MSPVLVDAREQKRDGPPMVGGSGEDRYILAGPDIEGYAKAPTELRLRERQPWVSDHDQANALALRLQFEPDQKGLSDGTRQREIDRQ